MPWRKAAVLLRLGVLGALCCVPALAEQIQNVAATQAAPGGERRVALVIGNSAYKSAPLKNPVRDARAISKALAATGFNVTLMEDASQASMRRAIRTFGDELARGGVGLFYYAGHGMQVRGRNFLVPTNADIQREDEIEDQAVDANLVLSKMDSAKNSLNILILDACRNNPFQRSFRSAAQGLAQMDAPSGTLISFATAPGSVAADGDGENGLYTKHLLTAIRQPGLPIEQLFKQVRIGVTRETGDRQIPWESSSLKGDFYFLPPDPNQGAAVQKAAIEQAVGEAVRTEQEKAAKERAAMQAEMKKLIEQLLAKQKAELQTELAKRPEQEAKQAAAPAAAPRRADPPAQVAMSAPSAVVSAAARSTAPKVGDTWSYRVVRSDGSKGRFRTEVTAVLEDSILETRIGGDGNKLEWVHTPGAHVLGTGGSAIFAFSPFLAAFGEIKVGDSWRKIQFQRLGDCSDDANTYCELSGKVVAREQVTVPAGSFDAYRIEIEQLVIKNRGRAIRNATFWYAPAVKRYVKSSAKLVSGRYPGPDFDMDLVHYKLR